MDAGILRKLFEQTVKTVLVDRVVLHAFRLLHICATRRLSCSGDWLLLRSLSGVRRPRTPLLATTVGAPAPIALPSIPAAGIELNMLPSAIAAAGKASGPAADKAAATVLIAGVAVAQLGGTDSFPD